MKKKRLSWDEYFMEIAKIVAKRSTCDRLNVGAVIVSDRNILSTGYNGSPKGLPHCDDVGHEISDRHCVRTIHAEANAIIQAAKHGTTVENASIYLTNSPCYDCFKMIVNSGIKEVIYGEFYNSRYDASAKVLKLAKKTGIKIRAFGLL
jgi:dCMP deaminase